MIVSQGASEDFKKYLREKALPWARKGGVERIVFCRPPIDPIRVPLGVSVSLGRAIHSPPLIPRRSWEVSKLWEKEHLCAYRFPHLACVLEGVAEIQVETTVLRLPPGTFLLVPPHVPIDDDRPHYHERPLTTPVMMVWLLITPSVIRGHLCFSDPQKHSYTPPQLLFVPQAYPLTLALMEEMTHQSEGFREVATAYLIALLWQVLRAAEEVPAPLLPFIEAPLQGDELVLHAKRLLLQNLQAPIDIKSLATTLGVSPSCLKHRFKRETGRSIREYIRGMRLCIAQYFLRHTNLPISVIAQFLGFYDPFHFSRWFRRWTGVAPSSFRSPHHSKYP